MFKQLWTLFINGVQFKYSFICISISLSRARLVRVPALQKNALFLTTLETNMCGFGGVTKIKHVVRLILLYHHRVFVIAHNRIHVSRAKGT